MLNNCDVSAFIATAHGRRAKAFYTNVLGLPLVEDSAAALVFGSPFWSVVRRSFEPYSLMKRSTLMCEEAPVVE